MASDDGVRSTNDDAAQCKRFAVEKGYWKDPYISLFTPRGRQSHAPEINIGYYARVKGLRVFLDKFISVSYRRGCDMFHHPRANLYHIQV